MKGYVLQGKGERRCYVVAPASSLVPIPGNMSYAEAATVPMNGLTALAALDLLDLKPGSRLLVTGGACAPGGYAISLARHQGHFVIADGREGDRELLLQLGAGMVVPRGEAMAAAVREAAPGGVDGLVDAARLGEKGHDARTRRRYVHSCAPRGIPGR